jgi:pimeloyl-ACP methyl ester carboxylesterase
MVAEGLRQTNGTLDEYRVFVEPWGFDPAEITQPVGIWWGDQDQLVPRGLIDVLVDLVPSCELNVVPAAGHFVAFDRWSEVLAPHAT